jgi:pimeloyl-ACP methyl ester carboxylesterase
MPHAIAMPRLGMTMQEGSVVEWRVRPGDRVARGQIVLVIESEKTEIEIESTAAGVVRHVYVEPGATVPCGTLLAALTEAPDEPFDAAAFRAAAERDVARPAPAKPATQAPDRAGVAAPGATATRGAPVTPAARRRAKELGIDPARVAGSGPGGRVTEEDVMAWAERARSRVAVRDGVELDVPTQGSGATVLLLPGFGTDVSAFARQIPALAARFRVRGVNPRGVALSDAPESEAYAVAEAAADVAALCGPEGAHVVGASLGAAIALELALAHPESVRSLVLVTPFARAGGRLLAVLDAWCRLASESSPEALAAAIVPWLFSATYLEDDARRARAVRGLAELAPRVPAPTLRRAAAGLRAWSGTRERELERVKAPTLVIAAGDDLLTPHADRIAAAIGGARLVSIPNAGHAVSLESPDAVTQAVLAHLG